MPQDANASISILVVPDGVRAGKLRLSLLLTPYVADAASGEPVLLDWPSEIRARLSRLALFRADIAKSGGSWTRVGPATPIALDQPPSPVPAGASELWADIFPDPNALRAALLDLRDHAGEEDLSEPTRARMAPIVDTAFLADAVLERRLAQAELSLEGLLAEPRPQAETDRAGQEELLAWAVPGSAQDPAGRVREQMLVDARRARNKVAVASAVSPRAVGAPWRADDYSHSRLQAIYAAACIGCGADADLAAAVEATRPRDSKELLSSRLRSLSLALNAQSAAQADTPAAEAPAVVDPAAAERNRIARKLAAIQSYPTVARHLGMIVDVEIDEGNLPDGYGALAVTFGEPPDAPATCWTCYANHRDKRRFFGPCDEAEAERKREDRAAQEFVRGTVNLGQAGGKRYKLIIVDAVNSAQSDQNHARAAMRDGMRADPLPDISGRGIALLDTDSLGAEERAAKARKRLREEPFKLHFAADLVRGFRPSVGVCEAGAPAIKLPAGRWRSLVDREIKFNHKNRDIPGDERDRSREAGQVRMMIGTETNADRSVTIQLPQEVFVWTGDSLGVPANEGDKDAGRMIVEERELLPLHVTLDLPKRGPGRGLPPLREGRSYVVGLSPAFVNGCGSTFAEAHEIFAGEVDLLLGAPPSNPPLPPRPFVFERMSRIPAPVVLLAAADEPLVTAADTDFLHGEDLPTLVVRDGRVTAPRRRPPRRYLYPERVPFDRAEQQGQFDKVKDPQPPGAFSTGRIEVKRGSKGEFPEPSDTTGNRLVRGPYLEPVPPGSMSETATPYYPDGYTVGAVLAARANIPADAAMPTLQSVPFRAPAAAAIEAMPIILELRPPSTPLPPNQRVRFIDEEEAVPHVTGKLRKLVIELRPGTIVDLDIAAMVDLEQAAASHYVRNAIGRRRRNGLPGQRALAGLFGNVLKTRIMELLQATGRVRLVHAVRSPASPGFRWIGGTPKRLNLAAVHFTESPERKWADYVRDRLAGPSPPPVWQWPSMPGGTTCYFVGEVEVDGPATGTVSCDATWLEYGPEAVIYPERKQGASAPNPAQWVFTPPLKRARMFQVENVSSSGADKNDRVVVDLTVKAADEARALTDENKARALSYSFPDGRARKLSLDLVSVSRFVDYYDRNGATGTGVRHGRPDTGHAESCTPASETMWAPCTFRPAPPDVRRVSPWFEITTKAPSGSARLFTFERRCRLRVELGPDGYSSGEDERLALVFNAVPASPSEYMAGRFKNFARAVTRWGSDPLARTPVPRDEIGVADFHAPPHPWGEGEDEKRFHLPAGPDTIAGLEAPPGGLEVEVLGYPLKFDTVTGTFYTDIAVDPARMAATYMPFVQLGFARFQPHAIRGQELSFAVSKLVQLLPRRRGTVEVKRGSTLQYKVVLEGPIAANGRHELEVSVVMRPGGSTKHWLPVSFDSVPEPMRSFRPSDSHRFDTGFQKITRQTDEHLGLLIEEYELIDAKPSAPGSPQAKRRLIFGHVVDIGPPRRA